jgi:hypothetical protein
MVIATPIDSIVVQAGVGQISRSAFNRGRGQLSLPSSTGIPRAERNYISIVCLPADGTALPNEENGDFGRSPIYRQPSDKMIALIQHGVPNVEPQ